MNVLLINGWSAPASYWTGLADGCEVIDCCEIVNLNSQLSRKEWLNEIERKIRVPTVLLGWSLGGMLALELASRKNANVLGVGVMQSNLRFVRDVQWPCAMDADVFDQFFSYVASSEPGQVYRRFAHMMLQGDRHKRQDLRALSTKEDSDLWFEQAVLVQSLQLLADMDVTRMLDQIEVPIHLVFGSCDQLVPVEAAKAVCEVSDGVVVDVIDGMAHVPFLSHWEQVKCSLVNFIGRVSAGFH